MGYHTPKLYTITGAFTTTQNPIDSTTYYGGSNAYTFDTTAGKNKMTIPISGHIKSCHVRMLANTVTGTAEDWPMYVRLNNTTDTLIETVSEANAFRDWINDSLNIIVTKGDYVEIKMVTPAWVTNPEGIRGTIQIIIEAE